MAVGSFLGLCVAVAVLAWAAVGGVPHEHASIGPLSIDDGEVSVEVAATFADPVKLCPTGFVETKIPSGQTVELRDDVDATV